MMKNNITMSKLNQFDPFISSSMDLGMPIQDETTSVPERANDTYTNNDPRLGSVLKLADHVTQNIILHPFVTLRRTCQVNRKCSPFICVQPISLLPFLYHQQRKHGLTALYKGLSSELLVKGITLGAETAIINYTDWPREISYKRFLKDSLGVLALRGLAVAITTPFLCSAVKETIQSVIVVRDTPSFLDCLRDGFLRLIHLRSIPSARMLPIWLLVVPTVVYHVSHSAIWHVASKFLETLNLGSLFAINSSTRGTQRRKIRQLESTVIEEESGWHRDELTYDVTETSFTPGKVDSDSNQISNSIIASFVADVALLPIETVLNSLYIQGTRTIIDNVDETTVVLPVLTNYDGFGDCYRSILKFEGNMGLYKGLGAIILQYSVHYLIFRALYHVSKNFETSGTMASPPRVRRTIRSIRPDHRRLMENNRHSTPNNPNLTNPHLDSMIPQDNSMGLDSSRSRPLDLEERLKKFTMNDN